LLRRREKTAVKGVQRATQTSVDPHLFGGEAIQLTYDPL
jgi:hypothetical protein